MERGLDEIAMVVDGLDHPECVAIDRQGYLWAGGEAGQVYRVDLSDKTVTTVGTTDGFILGITPDGDGHVWLCDIGQRALIAMDGGSGGILKIIREVQGRALFNPNYAVFDSAGNLYVSDSGHGLQRDGFVFVVRPDGRVHLLQTGLHSFPNGMALSKDEATLYVVESDRPGISALDLKTMSSRLVASLPGTLPDGIAVAENGDLFVACYRPDAILRITAEGDVSTYVADPRGTDLAAPTNIAFGGADRNTLYIASLGRWHIGALTMPVAGIALRYPSACALTARTN